MQKKKMFTYKHNFFCMMLNILNFARMKLLSKSSEDYTLFGSSSCQELLIILGNKILMEMLMQNTSIRFSLE